MLEEKGADVGEAIVGCGEKPPGVVKVVPRLQDDLGALMELLEPETPPKRTVRPKQGASVVYGFGDASGSGFGTSFAGAGEVTYAHGQWDEEHKAKTSNFIELANIVYALERAQRQGTLKNSEVFLFTDNGTAEAAFFKGTSKSEKLFELVLRLHKIHMHGEIVLHLVHVAGRRRISQGTDGLSRGNPAERLGGSEDLLNHVPLHLNLLERQPHPLIEWMDSWLGLGPEITWLSPEDWYLAGHMKPCSVWTPAPCVADAALEQLAKANHKCPQHTHLVIIPCLMTARWR